MSDSSHSRELHARLEALNRQALEKAHSQPADVDDVRRKLRKRRSGPRASAQHGQAEPIVFRRELPRHDRPSPLADEALGPFVALEEAVDGAVTRTADGSRVFVVERRLGGAEGAWCELCENYRSLFDRRDSGIWAQIEHAGLTGSFAPDDLLFFDLETTGLGSSPLFLIGAMVRDGQDLVVRQFFARDYSEEPAAVALFLDALAERRLLVSFNGKSFDLPYVRMRAAANGLDCPLNLPHLDLLHAARRAWKGELPNCRLQTIERLVCGRLRQDDIPSHLIPDAYHAYVRTTNAAQMVSVLEHNFLDLVTLAELMVRMPAP